MFATKRLLKPSLPLIIPRIPQLFWQQPQQRNFSINPVYHATTVLNVRKGNQVAMVADGQVSLGNTVFKNTAKKLRKLNNDKVVCGMAGSAADCLTLIELLEKEFEKYPG